MKALVLFRSYFGNTKRVAEVIAREVTALGHEAIVQDLRTKLPDLTGMDFIFIGAPTRMARVNRRALRALKRLAKKGAAQKPIAVFDTHGPVPAGPEEREKAKKWLDPGASGKMQKVAKELGLNVYPTTLRCEVQGMKGPLGNDGQEKAASFTREFVVSIEKKPTA
ncbi:MAG: flavodoxin domain-containing protein [Candidatus Aminicenantales bacterium]|jgi:flavodoxin